MKMKDSFYLNTFVLLNVLAAFQGVSGTPKYFSMKESGEDSHYARDSGEKSHSGRDNGVGSPYENLLQRLEEGNALLKSSLHARDKSRETLNEVDDFDYYMDQRAVQRAWSRDQLKRHEEYMNTHYMKLVTKNIELVLNTAQCKIPTRRCLDVNKMEFGKSKKYWPNCAIVHKCGHDSGCCKYSGHVCSPVESENIDLYFLSVEHNNDKQTGRVERLTFENHTLCDCRPMPQISLIPKSIECECPKEFTPVVSSLECRCDCDKKNSKPCKRIKNGKRTYYSKGCKGKCGPPACDYGEFKTNFGRCPRKNDKGKRRK